MKCCPALRRVFITIGLLTLCFLGGGCSSSSRNQTQTPKQDTAKPASETGQNESAPGELVFLEVEHDLDADDWSASFLAGTA